MIDGRILKKISLLFITLFLLACGQRPWNNPYPKEEESANIRYSYFSGAPKTLDPARAYSTDEGVFIAQVYEPTLQYAYLKRPYTLIPLTAAKMPTQTYLDVQGNELSSLAKENEIALTRYDIEIKPGIYYQAHPAFAKDSRGRYLYHDLNAKNELPSQLSDFPSAATRELTSEDYVYEIKRLAKPGVNSPIFGFMTDKIVGLLELSQVLSQLPRKSQWVDLRQFPLAGVKVIDRYHYQIFIKGRYPQFLHWLAKSFFAPIPWEADKFYAQPSMIQKNMTFDWYPVGTGPYTLIENNPNRRMVLQKNPFFRPEFFPSEGTPEDFAAGYLKNAGKRLPLIDKVIFSLEKESIPRWVKFLQGYYDRSTINSDSFEQAIQINSQGQPYLTPEMQSKGIYLKTSMAPAISYIGFNMLDSVVGGYSERARKLRLAISIAINYEEFINIFLNGRGVPAQGPLPPGIFGYTEGEMSLNRYVYDWKEQPVRKPLEVAKRLLAEAGYPNGIDPKTHGPLLLNYDVASTSGPDEKSLLAWMREQFAKIGIQLNIQSTEYNRFREEVRKGEVQIFSWAWVADYPDPENFLFLLYGKNSKAKFGGENATNYHNPKFDKLFDQIKAMPDGSAKQMIINDMLEILRHDAPWVWGVYQKDFFLNHIWDAPTKPNALSFNTIKYQSIDPILRKKLRNLWNKRIVWPFFLLGFIFLLLSFPVFLRYQRKERKSVSIQHDS